MDAITFTTNIIFGITCIMMGGIGISMLLDKEYLDACIVIGICIMGISSIFLNGPLMLAAAMPVTFVLGYAIFYGIKRGKSPYMIAFLSVIFLPMILKIFLTF